jgi:hypothetical protein
MGFGNKPVRQNALLERNDTEESHNCNWPNCRAEIYGFNQ